MVDYFFILIIIRMANKKIDYTGNKTLLIQQLSFTIEYFTKISRTFKYSINLIFYIGEVFKMLIKFFWFLKK